jgi:hypothetical protein
VELLLTLSGELNGLHRRDLIVARGVHTREGHDAGGRPRDEGSRWSG